ncbi:MAG TPA: hypothetical protein VN039_02870 [Nitrospira sp.]|nr:hypothetical protein [Nitrospira sp.]
MRKHINVTRQQLNNIVAANPTFLIEWDTFGIPDLLTSKELDLKTRRIENARGPKMFDVEVNEVFRTVHVTQVDTV